MLKLVERVLRQYTSDEGAALAVLAALSSEYLLIPTVITKLSKLDLEILEKYEKNHQRAAYLILKGVPNEVAISWANFNYPEDTITEISTDSF
jgi:predicted nucleotide-binding protein